MKIDVKRVEKVYFKDIKIGEIFKFAGNYFLKIASEGKPNAYCLGNQTLDSFLPHDTFQIIPATLTLEG